MPRIPVGALVTFRSEARKRLACLPPSAMDLRTAPHPAAVRAESANPHTQLIGLDRGTVTWLGAVGEDLLSLRGEPVLLDVRALLAGVLLQGKGLWRVVRPDPLYPKGAIPVSTVYAGDRPWLVLGELAHGGIAAAPLNEASNPQWFTPVIPAGHLLVVGGKDSQLELAHVWSFPRASKSEGALHQDGRATVEQAVRKYFDLN